MKLWSCIYLFFLCIYDSMRHFDKSWKSSLGIFPSPPLPKWSLRRGKRFKPFNISINVREQTFNNDKSRCVAPLEKALVRLIHIGNHLWAGQISIFYVHFQIVFRHFNQYYNWLIMWWYFQTYFRCAYCATNYTLIAMMETFQEDLWLNMDSHSNHCHHELQLGNLSKNKTGNLRSG